MTQLWIGEAPTWHVVKRCYVPARLLADGHYSRQTPGADEFMASGETLVLWHETEQGGAVWGAIHNLDPAGNRRWRCSIFRNLSGDLSSDLVREATRLTYLFWERHYGARPTIPLTTEVDPAKTRRKRDPGRCFRKAGWSARKGLTRGLVVLDAPP